MKMTKPFFISALPLFLVLFLDGTGLGLIIPILNTLIFDKNTAFISAHITSPLAHTLIYGTIMGIFMLSWFFGAAILGDLSDQMGRKKSLLICLLGAGFSYLLSALAVICHSVLLLILGRVLAGLTSGSQPIAQAAIVDLSTEEDKARNIGYILFSLSLGFILGPLLGGLLCDSRIVSWFNFTTPFYFAALLAGLNAILLSIFFIESFQNKNHKLIINPYHAITIFVSAFTHEKVKALSFIFFIFMLGWSSFYSFMALFLLKSFAFTATELSLFMAVMGIGFAIGNGFLVNYITRRHSLIHSFQGAALLTAVFIFLIVGVHQSWMSWVLIAPIAASFALAYSALIALFSNQVEANRQGWVMGITGSMMAFVWGIDNIIVSIFSAWSVKAPLYIAGFSFLSVVIITYFVLIQKSRRSHEVFN